MAMAAKNTILASKVETRATLAKPKTAAVKAMIRKRTAHPIMAFLHPYTIAPSAIGRKRAIPAKVPSIAAISLFQLEIALHFVIEADAAHRKYDFRRQFFVALELAALHRVADRLFDLALRGDADGLQKLAQTDVELVLVHDFLLRMFRTAADLKNLAS